MTALHLGVSGRHVETVKELAENADPSALNAIDSVSIKSYCSLSLPSVIIIIIIIL